MVIENVEQQRISRLEGICEQVDRRLDEMNRSIESLRTEMNSRMDSRFNMLIMVMVAS